jgi:hypothetical protein
MTSNPPDGPAAPDGGGEAFAEAHRALLADGSIQFELKNFEPPQTPDWLRWLGEFLTSEHPVLQGLLWVVAGALALLILYFVARWLRGRGWRWRRGGEEECEGWRPETEPARALLGEADALAARGEYAEAVHLLLFRSIEDLGSRRPELVRPALTSRDIAALPAIPERPRGAFARIAMAVERSLFARRPLAEGDWRECRAAYESFAFAESWQG